MQKYFYSNLVDTTSIALELAEMDLTQEERVHLVSLVESNIHHAILDIVLSELSEEDKKEFLRHITSDNHDKVWELLNSKVEHIEDKIKVAAQELKKELHKDIREAREKGE